MTSVAELDPAVQEQLSQGEAVLAEFMDGLSKTISRYNTLLAKALPQNPKAHFYYYNEEDKKAQSESEPSAEKKPKTEDGSAAASTSEDKPKNPTSPLLRRPQLQKDELEKIKVEAKEELLRRQSSVGDFPMVGEEEKPVKAHSISADKKSAAAHHGHSHGHHGHIKKHHKKEGEEGAEASEEKGDEKAEKAAKKSDKKKEPKSLLPSLFEIGQKKDKKKKAEKEEKGDEKEDSPKVILTEAEAAADNEDWEDETDEDEDGAEMTVQQLFEKIAPSPQLLQEVRVLKGEARDISVKFEIIHDWIAMNLPALGTEEGQSTEIMGAIIEALMGFMATVEEIYGQEATYLAERAELELEFLQNPEIATGLARIAILDNDTWDNIENGYRALMRCYLIAHSQLAKNMESIRSPIRRRVNLSI